ncbi:hypothetical protein ScPMuIL_010607, partial [Solemya velum]
MHSSALSFVSSQLKLAGFQCQDTDKAVKQSQSDIIIFVKITVQSIGGITVSPTPYVEEKGSIQSPKIRPDLQKLFVLLGLFRVSLKALQICRWHLNQSSDVFYA